MVAALKKKKRKPHPRKIFDEFTDLPVSKQRKLQLRWKRDGNCIICGDRAVLNYRCLKHAVAQREQRRRKYGWVARLNSASYRLEKQAVEKKGAKAGK